MSQRANFNTECNLCNLNKGGILFTSQFPILSAKARVLNKECCKATLSGELTKKTGSHGHVHTLGCVLNRDCHSSDHICLVLGSLGILNVQTLNDENASCAHSQQRVFWCLA